VGAFKGNVKMNFFQGASIPDPHKLFNAGLEAKKTRAIDFHEGDRIDETAVEGPDSCCSRPQRFWAKVTASEL
jgi:hypothetical protein